VQDIKVQVVGDPDRSRLQKKGVPYFKGHLVYKRDPILP